MTFILRIIASPVFRAMWRPFALLLGLVGFGAMQRRKGAQAAQDRHKAAQAEAYRKTVERVLDEKPSNDTTDAIRRRVRQRAERKP